MDVEILRQLDQGLLALDRGYSDLSLEGRAVVPARSSRHGHLLARSSHAGVARKIHLSRLFSFPEPPLPLKDRFVALNADAKLGLFGHSPTARVLQGKDGYWFLGDDAAIDGALGVVPPALFSDAAWAAHFAALAQAFKARGAPFVFILGPDKHGVYREALPDWLSAAMPAPRRSWRKLAR
jgi:hypothetical protein